MGEMASGLLPPRRAAVGTGIAPIDKRWTIRTGTLCQKLQASDPVFIPPLGQRAVSGVVAKGGKVRAGQPSSVEDNERVHMPVGRVVIVDRGHKLYGLAITLLEL